MAFRCYNIALYPFMVIYFVHILFLFSIHSPSFTPIKVCSLPIDKALSLGTPVSLDIAFKRFVFAPSLDSVLHILIIPLNINIDNACCI